MFDSIREFNRQQPVNEMLVQNVESICNKISHNVAVKEMECLCKAMTEHNDYDINHYSIKCQDTSDVLAGRWSIDIFVEYKEKVK